MIIYDINKKFFHERTNTFLYHYTSPDSLLNIINKASLRFTDIEFLNDKDEYNYILKLIKDISKDSSDEVSKYIAEKSKGVTSENIGYIISRSTGKSRCGVMEDGKYYVLSGTEEDDSLPMWVYYAKNGQYAGYSLKMNIKKIASAFKNIDGEFYYGKVVYDKKTQVEILKQLTLGIIKKMKEKIADSDDDLYRFEAQEEFWDMIDKVRLFFKRKEFSHEKEIRIALLARPDEDKKMTLGHQSVNGLIKPYIEYEFPDKKLPIVSVTISPSIESTIGKKGLMSLLMNNGYRISDYLCSVDIKKSKINLRY